MVTACTTQTLRSNNFFTKDIPRWTEKAFGEKWDVVPNQPPTMNAFINYTRMYQRWNMFAPNVPKSEGWLVIDAKLADGRRLDPQTGREPHYGPVDFTAGVDFGQMWRIYTKRIVKKRYKHFRKHLRAYLLNRHRVEGLPASERIVEFEAWWIRDLSPKPGAENPAKETSRFKVESFVRNQRGDPDESDPDESDDSRQRRRRGSRTTRLGGDGTGGKAASPVSRSGEAPPPPFPSRARERR